MSEPYGLYPLASQSMCGGECRRMLRCILLLIRFWCGGGCSGPADQIVGDLVCFPGSLLVPQVTQDISVVCVGSGDIKNDVSDATLGYPVVR
ncbi:hypothetical protein SLA2020_382220 [Shorea laevis]